MGSYNTFIVRIWSDQRTRMHGTIEHVRSQDSLVFVDPEVIAPFILSHVDYASNDIGAPNEEAPLVQGEPSDDASRAQ